MNKSDCRNERVLLTTIQVRISVFFMNTLNKIVPGILIPIDSTLKSATYIFVIFATFRLNMYAYDS